MSDEQKPSDPADKAADGGFLAWVASHPTARLASGEGALLLAENNRLRDENTALTAERDRLAAAVERVRTLHVGEKRHVGWIDVTCCRECSDDDNTYAYPCPTLRALEGMP